VRISTTTLESFRLWRRGRVDEADLVATITGEFVPTARVLLGQAYGRILEDPDGHRTTDGYACGQYRFEADAVDPALETIDRRGCFEVKTTRVYGLHTVVAKADYLLGARLEEFKTRLGSYDWQKYAESYQWRFELDLFGALSCTYRVFRLTKRRALRSIEALTLYPYPTLHADCSQLVDAFIGYVRRRGLESYLTRNAEGAQRCRIPHRESGSIPEFRYAFTNPVMRGGSQKVAAAGQSSLF
jgi:hypothetical protein